MSRDYKKKMGKSKQEKSPLFGNILSFLSGLSIGLFITFYVFLRYQLPGPVSTVTGKLDNDNSPPAATDTQPLPEPVFDFYKILPNKKINISEWLPEEEHDEEQEVRAERGAEHNVYVVQVGSFKDFKAADQIKAKLALMGVFADIQRIVINGQDIWHRVRLGPYKSVDEMKQVRQILEDNRFEFVELKLPLEEDTG